MPASAKNFVRMFMATTTFRLHRIPSPLRICAAVTSASRTFDCHASGAQVCTANVVPTAVSTSKTSLSGHMTPETFSQVISRCSVTPSTTRGGGIRIISPFSNRPVFRADPARIRRGIDGGDKLPAVVRV